MQTFCSTCQSQTHCCEAASARARRRVFREEALGEEALAEGELRQREAHGEDDEHQPGREQRLDHAFGGRRQGGDGRKDGPRHDHRPGQATRRARVPPLRAT